MQKGLISVVMPVRNVAPFVEAAARSVLSQPGVALELIVVEDGSQDASRAIVESLRDPRLRIVDGPRHGIAAALNVGLQAARGEYIGRCDGDDLFAPSRLERQLRCLEQRPDFVAVCGQFATMTHSGRPLAEMDCGLHACEITGELRSGSTRTSLCTYLIRAEVARALGFRPAFVTAEDIDFAFRLGEAGRVWFEPRVEYRYRLHGRSITHSQSNARRAHYEAKARELQADRLAAGQDALMRGQPIADLPRDCGTRLDPTSQSMGVLLGAAWRYRRDGRRIQALWTGMRACTHAPANMAGWRSLAALLLKRSAD